MLLLEILLRKVLYKVDSALIFSILAMVKSSAVNLNQADDLDAKGKMLMERNVDMPFFTIMPTQIQDCEEFPDEGDFSESHLMSLSSMSLSPSQSSDDDFQHIVDNSHDDSIMLQIHAFLRQRSSPCQESQIPAAISHPHYQHAMDTADDSADDSMDGSDYSPFTLIETDLKTDYDD
eukprot:gene24041-32455_t